MVSCSDSDMENSQYKESTSTGGKRKRASSERTTYVERLMGLADPHTPHPGDVVQPSESYFDRHTKAPKPEGENFDAFDIEAERRRRGSATCSSVLIMKHSKPLPMWFDKFLCPRVTPLKWTGYVAYSFRRRIRFGSWPKWKDVPDSVKEEAWADIMESWDFKTILSDEEKENLKKQWTTYASKSLRNWRTSVWNRYVAKVKPGTEPGDPLQQYKWMDRQEWDLFVAYRSTEEFKELSKTNSENALKKLFIHHTGSGGYRTVIVKKANEMREEAISKRMEEGMTREQAEEEVRSMVFMVDRSIVFLEANKDEKGNYSTEFVKNAADEIIKLNKQKESGELIIEGRADILEMVLGEDHPGRFRGCPTTAKVDYAKPEWTEIKKQKRAAARRRKRVADGELDPEDLRDYTGWIAEQLQIDIPANIGPAQFLKERAAQKGKGSSKKPTVERTRLPNSAASTTAVPNVMLVQNKLQLKDEDEDEDENEMRSSDANSMKKVPDETFAEAIKDLEESTQNQDQKTSTDTKKNEDEDRHSDSSISKLEAPENSLQEKNDVVKPHSSEDTNASNAPRASSAIPPQTGRDEEDDLIGQDMTACYLLVINSAGKKVPASRGSVIQTGQPEPGFEAVFVRTPLFLPDADLPVFNEDFATVASAAGGVPVLWPESLIDYTMTEPAEGMEKLEHSNAEGAPKNAANSRLVSHRASTSTSQAEPEPYDLHWNFAHHTRVPQARKDVAKWLADLKKADKSKEWYMIPLKQEVFGPEIRELQFSMENAQSWMRLINRKKKEWINGWQMNMWASLLRSKMHRSDRGRIQMVSSFCSFAGYNTEEDNRKSCLENVKKLMTARDARLYVMPFCHQSHWMLFLISPESSIIYCIDPQAIGVTKEKRPFVYNLFMSIGKVYDTVRRQRPEFPNIQWTFINLQHKCQISSWECGYYVMLYMEKIVLMHSGVDVPLVFPADAKPYPNTVLEGLIDTNCLYMMDVIAPVCKAQNSS